MIGEGNRFAHAAALAVAELPAQAYNPLFLHGPPGLGKTHLLHAIGNYVQRYGAGLRVRYATIEEFTSEFVDAVRARRTDDFKDDFRSADVVLIDDVQFLAGRTKTREEFFHTFNALLDSGRQLVITSDRSPEELPDLEDRLAERFRAGLVVELEPPPRSAFAGRSSPSGRGSTASTSSSEVLAEIAQRVDSSVRALEGALIRVVAYASLKGEQATPGLVRHVLRRLGRGHRPGRLRHRGDPRRGGAGVRRRARGAARPRPPPGRRRRPPGRHVPRTRAHRAQPPRDRARHRRAQPHHRAPRRQPDQRGAFAPTRLCATRSTTSTAASAARRDGRRQCDNPQPSSLSPSRIRAPVDLSTGPTNSRSGSRT